MTPLGDKQFAEYLKSKHSKNKWLKVLYWKQYLKITQYFGSFIASS